MSKKYIEIVSIILLLSISSFLRVYRIDEHTEFLGDQGRTGIEIYRLWERKELPLVGPQVLAGQYLGPFFYYLVGPVFILSNFNPLVPAIFMALLGIATVFMMFYVARRFFDYWIGFFVTCLYAVSSYIVTQSRTLWDPNPIPFFVLLFVLSVYKIYEQKQFKYFLLLGFTLSALIQLHYPNLFFIGLTSLFLLWATIKKKIILTNPHHIKWLFAGTGIFILVIFPFLIYEFQNQFSDIKSVIKNFLFSKSIYVTYSLPAALKDQSSRLFKNIIDIEQSITFTTLQLITIFIPLLKKRLWYFFFLVWLGGGLVLISLHKEVIVEHYLMFLLPVPFFLFGFFLETLKRRIPRGVLYASLSVLVLINLFQTDVFSKGSNDIYRTQSISNEIIQQSNNRPFSFTLLSSRSFSDLHYRYFFEIKKIKPESIYGKDYDLLFLVCDRLKNCPPPKQLMEKQMIDVLCFEYHCQWSYPKIDLNEFIFVKTKKFSDGRVYTFAKKTVPHTSSNQ